MMRLIAAVAAALVIGIVGTYMILGGRVSAAPAAPWQLIDHQAYKADDFKSCIAAGDVFVQWHFGGKDRSVLNHNTPGPVTNDLYFRVVTNDPKLPVNHMRVVPVQEPAFDGRRFGNRAGWRAEYNGVVRPQRKALPACGTSR